MSDPRCRHQLGGDHARNQPTTHTHTRTTSQFQGDPSWSETGDRYILKLVRNFVFHQTDDRGVPVLDMGHIVESLNKVCTRPVEPRHNHADPLLVTPQLDVGDPEEVLLSSPDAQTLLMASYDDMRRCLNSTYDELRQRKTATPAQSAMDVVTVGTAAAATGGGRGMGGPGSGAAGGGLGMAGPAGAGGRGVFVPPVHGGGAGAMGAGRGGAVRHHSTLFTPQAAGYHVPGGAPAMAMAHAGGHPGVMHAAALQQQAGMMYGAAGGPRQATHYAPPAGAGMPQPQHHHRGFG